MKKRDKGGLDPPDLDDLIEEITVDANGEDEQLWAFRHPPAAVDYGALFTQRNPI